MAREESLYLCIGREFTPFSLLQSGFKVSAFVLAGLWPGLYTLQHGVDLILGYARIIAPVWC